MKNKSLRLLLDTVAAPLLAAASDLENLGQALATKLRGGSDHEHEGTWGCDLGCVPNVSCG